MDKKNKNYGQILPTVLIIGAVLAILSYAFLNVFSTNVKIMVKSFDIMKKLEIANVGLEHARYFLQTGNNWGKIPVDGYKYDKEYQVSNLGSYTLYIMKGNLFVADGSRQGLNEYRTIGIKVKVKTTGSTNLYYAVVQRVGYGGPLISRGKIDLPCNDAAINNNKYNFYWGDIYSANPNDNMCRIPSIPVARGTEIPPPWMPAVYAAGNIYTALRKIGTSYVFGFTYDDMSPTAKCHPYSAFAKAPDISFNVYKQLAADQGNYYGPATIDGVANPYYVGKNLSDVNGRAIARALSNTSNVVFIDTSDGKPLSYNPITGRWNTYTTYIHATMSANTIKLYENANCQFYAVGSLIVMGPIILKGHDPGPEAPKGKGQVDPMLDYWPTKVFVERPTNYYYPQDDSDHFDYRGDDPHGTRIDDIKFAGFLYVGGELRIGGPRCKSGTCHNNLNNFNNYKIVKNIYNIFNFSFPVQELYAGGPAPTPTPSIPPCVSDGKTDTSDICIYGTVYIGEYGSLTVDTTNDDPKLYVYFNSKTNAFAFLQANVIVNSFKEITFLVPTPAPDYPTF